MGDNPLDDDQQRFERANRLYAKIITITLYSTTDEGSLEKELEGECLNISKTGFAANVKPVSRYFNINKVMGMPFMVQFYLPGVRLPMVNCTIVRTDNCQDLRYDMFIGAKFEYSIDLSALISRLLALSR